MTLCLSDPETTAEFLRLLIGPDERRRESAWFVLCEGQRPVQPVVVDELEDMPDDLDRREIVRPVAAAAVDLPDATVLAALVRPGRPVVQAGDAAWFRAVHDECRVLGLPVLGVWLTTPTRERPVHLDDLP